MMALKIYEIDPQYIDYLTPFAPHLFHNKKPGQTFERKYIGVVLTVNNLDYFAPLSSFKQKHNTMQEALDFIKIKNYAVINLNNMFPAPSSVCKYVDISQVRDPNYKALLLAEYRVIRVIQDKIIKNARNIYKHKIDNENKTALAKRCNDFTALEKAYHDYIR